MEDEFILCRAVGVPPSHACSDPEPPLATPPAMPRSTPLFPDDDPAPPPVAAVVPEPKSEPPKAKGRPTLYVLDAFSMIFQVFHAIPLMTGPAGQPTNAVFGIIRDIMNLLRDRKPDYLAAAFDGAGKVFRSDIFPQYKAQRAEMPDDLMPQINVVRRAFEAFNVPVLMFEGFEADDVIATLARRAEERDLDVYICTADKDAPAFE